VDRFPPERRQHKAGKDEDVDQPPPPPPDTVPSRTAQVRVSGEKRRNIPSITSEANLASPYGLSGAGGVSSLQGGGVARP
jgi:hypothetical protein